MGTFNSYFLQLIVPFITGGIVRTIRYAVATKKNGGKLTIGDGAIEFISGAVTGVVGVQVFNSEGNLAEVISISAFTGISGVAWIMSRSDISPEKEKEIMDAETKLTEVENKPVVTEEQLNEVEKQLTENATGKK